MFEELLDKRLSTKLFDILELLGKGEVVRRIEKAIEFIRARCRGDS